MVTLILLCILLGVFAGIGWWQAKAFALKIDQEEFKAGIYARLLESEKDYCEELTYKLDKANKQNKSLKQKIAKLKGDRHGKSSN